MATNLAAPPSVEELQKLPQTSVESLVGKLKAGGDGVLVVDVREPHVSLH